MSKCCAASAGDRSRGCGRKSSRSRRAVLGRFLTSGTASAGRAAGSTRCSTRSSSCRACRWSRRCSSTTSCRHALADYTPAAPRHAARRRRSVVGGRRAAGRSRRPHRALPDRSSLRALLPPATADAGAERARGRGARAAAGARRGVLRAAPRRRSAAASRRRPSTRCGRSCGRAWSPTTRCTRCARICVRRSARGRSHAPPVAPLPLADGCDRRLRAGNGERLDAQTLPSRQPQATRGS